MIRLASLLLVLFLAACAPSHGRVEDKRFEESHYTTLVTTQCTYTGKTTVCVPVTQLIWHSDAWYLTVCSDDVCGDVKVNQATYDRLQIGDWYDEREATL